MGETRTLITGGAGFIGSRLVTRLATAGMGPIWVLDNLHPQVHGPDAAPPGFPAGVTFLKGDVGDREAVEAAVRAARPHVVYHLAAETGTGQSMDELVRYCEVNVTGTALLLEALRREAPDLRRVVLSASRSVYGEGLYAHPDGGTLVPPPRRPEAMRAGRFDPATDDGRPLTPLASHAGIPVAPSSVYASTKLMQEHLIAQAGMTASWSAVLLRFQNVYGPGQSLRNPYTGVLSIFSGQLLAGRTLNIFEDGAITRDFVFVDDVVEALVKALSAEAPHGTVVDIGSADPVTIEQVARKLMALYGRPTDAYRVTGDFRAGDIRHAVADVTKAREVLGWTPRVGIDEGLAALARWCVAEKQEMEKQEAELSGR